MGSPNSNLPFPNAPGGGYASAFAPQQQQPPAQLPNFYNYLAQSFPNTAPEDLPDNAYQAMQEKFFQDHVAPWAMQEGHPLAPLQEGFMQQTARPKAEYPRLDIVGKSALAALAAPLKVFQQGPARGFADYTDQLEQGAVKEAARQGISPGPYQFVGQTLGTLPYWAAGAALAGPAVGALAPGLESAGLSGAAVEKLLHITTGALIQGSYDAAKAPEGSRLAEGFRGAAIGGGMVAGVELLKGLPYFLRSRGVPTEQAAAVGKVAQGLATPEEEKLATEATLTTPKIDEHIADYVQAQQAGTKAAGIPQVIDNNVAPTLLNLDVRGADGNLYTLGPYTEQSWRPGLPRLSEHLQNGGSLEAVRADQATAQNFLKALEEHIGNTTNTYDLDVPEHGAASTPDSYTEQRANDTILAQRMQQEEDVSQRWNANLTEAEQARVPKPGGYGQPIGFGENVAALPGGGRIVFRSRRLDDVIAARDSLYHATTVKGLFGILSEGEIRPGAVIDEDTAEDVLTSPGVSTSRTPTTPSYGGPVVLVLDPTKMPKATPFVPSPGYGKGIPEWFQFESRTEGTPVPVSAIKGVILDRSDPYLMDAGVSRLKGILGGYGLPVREVQSYKELFGYRAGISRFDPMFARSLGGVDKAWISPSGERFDIGSGPATHDQWVRDQMGISSRDAFDNGWVRVHGNSVQTGSLDNAGLPAALEAAAEGPEGLRTKRVFVEVGNDRRQSFWKGAYSLDVDTLRDNNYDFHQSSPRAPLRATRLGEEEMPWQDLGVEGEPLPIPPTEQPAALRDPDYRSIEIVKSLYDKGFAIQDIADRMGLSSRVVTNWLEANVKDHIPLETLGRNLTERELAALKEPPEGIDQPPFDTLAAKGRVRGSADVPMNDNGRDEITLNARILAGNYDTIRNGSLGRTREAADIIQRYNPRAQRFPDDPGFDSWRRGEFEGGDPDVARQFSDALVNDPAQWNTPQPGVSPYSGVPGESFSQFGQRVNGAFGTAFDHMDANPDQLGAIVTHYNPIRFIESQLRSGAPRDATIDFEHYLGDEPEPGAIYHIDPDYSFSKLDPATADPNRKGLDVWRHGETDWNPQAEPATYAERPLGFRKVSSMGFGEEAPDAQTIWTEPGEKPLIEYNRDILESMRAERGSSMGARGIIAHEMVHAHANNLDIHQWFKNTADNMVSDIYDNLLKAVDYPPNTAAEETFAYAMQAVRGQDDKLLGQLARADTDPETVLDWFVNKNLDLGDYLSSMPKSLHRDTFLRRLNYTAGQASRSLEDIRRPFTQTHDVGFDPDENMWYTEDLQNGMRHRFLSREDALSYLEQYQEPLNTPDLLPQDHFPRGFDFAARRLPGPSTARAPLTTDPPSPELQSEDVEKLAKTGVAAASNFIRPFYDWVGTVSNRLGRPDLANTFFAIDDAQVDFSNAMRPVEDLLKETLRPIADGRRPDLMPWLRATTDAGRDAAAAEFRYTAEELSALQRLQSEYPYSALWDYVQKDVPEMRQQGWDVETRYPKGLDDSMVGDLVRRGRLDPREEDPLKVAAEYARGQAFHDIVKPTIDTAQDLLTEDRKGPNDFGMLHPLLQRQLSYLRGNPDWTQQMVMGAVGKATQLINKVIDGANKLLPEKLQIGKIEEGPRDVLQQFILFNYAGALALRPAVPIRDALQLMLTTYPVLGEKYLWQGMRRAFSGAEDSLGRDAYEAALRNGWLIERSELPEMVAGGDTEGGRGIEGVVEHWTKKALSVISLAHNTNRLVAGWGHTLKMMDALESFAETGDQDAFIRNSDLWFLNPARRDVLVREAAQLASNPTQWEPFAQRAARNLVDATQWNYRRGANPGLYKYQLGRLFGQYGTWPMNYIEYGRKFYDAVTGPYKAEALLAMFRLGAAHTGVLGAAGAVGIDASHWVFTQPMAYGGGPMFTAITNIPGSLDFQTYKGVEARRNIVEPIWPGIIPGVEEAHGLWQAISEGGEGQWQRVLGFSPMKPGEEEQGWHRFVP